MKSVELPNGQSAFLYSKDEISERANRIIARAYMKAAATASLLATAGFDENDPKTWGSLGNISEEEQDALDGYQIALVMGMVKSWSFPEPIEANVILDLPSKTFNVLSDACSEAYSEVLDFTPDGQQDPKVPTAD